MSLLVSKTSAAGFTIAAVGAFGERLSNCRVDNFRLSNGRPEQRSEYKDSFHGLAASDLPDGDYEVAIRCREAEIATHVKVADGDRFSGARCDRRLMRSDHLVPTAYRSDQWPSRSTGDVVDHSAGLVRETHLHRRIREWDWRGWSCRSRSRKLPGECLIHVGIQLPSRD